MRQIAFQKGLSSALVNVSKNKYKKAMPKEEWWRFYESFLKKADSENAVKNRSWCFMEHRKCEGSSGMDGIYGSGER